MLEVKVQEPAITTLAYYYDPPLRCFTFCDFQLVPTFEEFLQILDMPTNNIMPYQHLEQPFSMYTLSEIMKISVKELKKEFVELCDIKGFVLSFLERHLCRLCEEESWDAYMDVLALALFGVTLFLKADSFVDDAAIKVF